MPESSASDTPTSPPEPTPTGGTPNNTNNNFVNNIFEYFYDTEDSPNNIVVENGLIKLATIEKLIERVTSAKVFDPNFVQIFLLTYRQFITPKALIDYLIARYDMPEPEGLSGEDLDNFRRTVMIPVRLRIYNLVKRWISQHWVDFDDNTEMINLLQSFINLCKTTQPSHAVNLEKIWKKSMDDTQKDIEYQFDKNPPKSIPMSKSKKTDHIPLLQIHPEEAARQFTLIEKDLFKSIKSWEFLNQGWTKSDKHTRAPGIMSMTKRFNDVSKWVATEIVSEKDKKGRVLILNRMIEVAERCKNLNNLNAMTSIIAGLQNSAIYRLKGLWPELPSKQLEIYEEMVELISSKQSYKNFREYLRRCGPPCIPYLGVFLTDLTFIEDGNPNLVNGMLNISKCRSISKVILEIQQFQQTPYCLKPVPEIQQYLNTLKFLDDEQCYKLSLQIEARAGSHSSSSSSSNSVSSPSSPPLSPTSSSSNGRVGSANGVSLGNSGGVNGANITHENTEVRIRLPSAKLPIAWPVTAQTTVGDTIKSLTKQFLLPTATTEEAEILSKEGNFQLVVPPSQTMYGAIVESDVLLKDLQIGDTVLDMWEHPISYKVGLSVQSDRPVFLDIVLSHTMELMKMIPIFQKVFDLISSEEFCFLYVEPSKDGYARFLRANRSLLDEKCSLTEGRLLIYPVSNFKMTAPMFAKGATKQGYLVKKTHAKYRQLLKTKKSRWFVLKDFFIFYFKSMEDQTYIGTIILDYYSCKLVEINGTKSIQLRPTCSEFTNHNCIYLICESESELDEWFSTINKRIVNSTSDMEGYLNMYILPNTSKNAAQKKWFCLEKNGSALQHAKTMQQPEYDDSIPLEESYCRLATNDLNRSEGESSFVLVTSQTQYLLVAGNVGLRDLWIEALGLHGVPFEKQVSNTAKTFGEELDVICQRENTTVPRFFSNVIAYLNDHGAQERDLFTTTPPLDEVNRLKDMIDEGIEIDFATCSSVYVVSFLLLQFLKEIPHTLLTYFRYYQFIDAAETEEVAQRVIFMKMVVDSLPNTHRAVLRELLEFMASFGSIPPIGPIAAVIFHDTDGRVHEIANVAVNTLVVHHKTVFPVVATAPLSPRGTTNASKKAQGGIHIPRLSKIFKSDAATSVTNLLSKVTSKDKDKDKPGHAHINSLNNVSHSLPSSPSMPSTPTPTHSTPTPSTPTPSTPTPSTPTHSTPSTPINGSPSAASPINNNSPSQPNPLNTSGTPPPPSTPSNLPTSAPATPTPPPDSNVPKIIVMYGDRFERTMEIELGDDRPVFTLKDCLNICEYDTGCLRSMIDPGVTIIADSYVIPPGAYQLTKPSRSDSFLGTRLKHLSIPVSQLLKLAEAQKAMAMDAEQAATAFKFPLSLQDSQAETLAQYNHLPRRPTRPPTISARSPPILKPRSATTAAPQYRAMTISNPQSHSYASIPPFNNSPSPTNVYNDDSPIDSPRSDDSPRTPRFSDSPRTPRANNNNNNNINGTPEIVQLDSINNNSNNHNGRDSPVNKVDESLTSDNTGRRTPPAPPSRASRTLLALSQQTDPENTEDPIVSSDSIAESEKNFSRFSVGGRRKIAPPRHSDIREVQNQLQQLMQQQEQKDKDDDDDDHDDSPTGSKIVTSPSMNNLASLSRNKTSPKQLRRVQTQPVFFDKDDPGANLAKIISSTARSPRSPSPPHSLSSPVSPNSSSGSFYSPVTSPPLTVSQRIIKGRPRKDSDKDKEEEKKEKDKDKKEKEHKDKEKKEKKDKEKQEKKERKEKEKEEKEREKREKEEKKKVTGIVAH